MLALFLAEVALACNRNSMGAAGRSVVVIKLVSGDSFRKTRIFAIKAGNFQSFAPQDRRTSSLETKSNVENAGFSRPLSRFLRSLAERMNAGLGRQVSN
jgi:hypothetical protein